MTVDEYLRTPYEWEPEYVHGELVERPYSTVAHAFLVPQIAMRLSHAGLCVISISLRIAPQIVRIADVAVFRTHPNKDIPDVPPMLIVEVITAEDRFTHIMQKLDEYRRWGVEHTWLVVPDLSKLYVCDSRGLMEVGQFELDKSAVRITAGELFSRPTVQ